MLDRTLKTMEGRSQEYRINDARKKAGEKWEETEEFPQGGKGGIFWWSSVGLEEKRVWGLAKRSLHDVFEKKMMKRRKKGRAKPMRLSERADEIRPDSWGGRVTGAGGANRPLVLTPRTIFARRN